MTPYRPRWGNRSEPPFALHWHPCSGGPGSLVAELIQDGGDGLTHVTFYGGTPEK